MIRDKGFLDCVAYISDEGITVSVAALDGLSPAGVAQITDVVTCYTEFAPSQLRVVEIK
jgi:hypothetical protein